MIYWCTAQPASQCWDFFGRCPWLRGFSRWL